MLLLQFNSTTLLSFQLEKQIPTIPLAAFALYIPLSQTAPSFYHPKSEKGERKKKGSA